MDNNNNNPANNNANNATPPKIYLGNAKQIQRRNGDPFLSAVICLDDLESSAAQEFVFTTAKGKRYLKLVVNPFKDGTNQYGNTHSISVDTFRPDPNYNKSPGQNAGGNSSMSDPFAKGSDENPF